MDTADHTMTDLTMACPDFRNCEATFHPSCFLANVNTECLLQSQCVNLSFCCPVCKAETSFMILEPSAEAKARRYEDSRMTEDDQKIHHWVVAPLAKFLGKKGKCPWVEMGDEHQYPPSFSLSDEKLPGTGSARLYVDTDHAGDLCIRVDMVCTSNTFHYNFPLFGTFFLYPSWPIDDK